MRALVVFLFLGAACQARKPHILEVLTSYMDKKQMASPTPTEYPNWQYTTTSPPYNNDSMEDMWGIQEAFMFPGSDYLIRLVENYVYYGMDEEMTPEDVKDYFELPDCDMKGIHKKVFKVAEILENPDDTSLYATRMLIRPVLKGRMRCPSAVLDVGIAKTIMRMKDEFLNREDQSYFTMFRDIVHLLDPTLEPYAEDLAQRGIHEFHGTIFNDTLEMIFTYGLKDVAFSAHSMYENLRFFFSRPDMYPSYDRQNMLMDAVHNGLWNVMCPSGYDVMENHRKVVQRFRDQFEYVETEHVCSRVREFLYEYVNNVMPGHVSAFENSIGLPILCDEIKGAIDDIVGGFIEYENRLYTMNMRELEEIIKEKLSPREWEVLEEALRRMGFSDMAFVRRSRHGKPPLH